MTHIFDSDAIIARIRQVREMHSGKRGKALFSKQLGLNPSTYNYYENHRVPPAEVLLKISQITGVSMEWLLTGQVSPADTDERIPKGLSKKIKNLLDRDPKAGSALEAFVDVLTEKTTIEDHLSQEPVEGASMIPVLGRTAAGVVHFWDAKRGKPVGLTELAKLIQRYPKVPQIAVDATLCHQQPEASLEDKQVKLIQINTPDNQGVSEFIEAPALGGRYPDAFALRIDGDSMSPTIQPGDLVVLSPSFPARPGQPAVIQLKGQIGVTCKIFRRDNDTIHLIPANTAYPPTDHSHDDLIWAYAVLSRVRV
ncbi:MAG: helix-turn-helix domain-containing protein [Sedimentisphaerales bacterium]|nr:helix-turn-helix domain-containing protein [Sedimentisphaerales bacterium]